MRLSYGSPAGALVAACVAVVISSGGVALADTDCPVYAPSDPVNPTPQYLFASPCALGSSTCTVSVCLRFF